MEAVDSFTVSEAIEENVCDSTVETGISLADKVASIAFMAASFLTDPICKAHELYRVTFVAEALNPTAHAVEKLAKKVFIYIAIIACATVAVFSTLPGIVLRYLAAHIQSTPYLYLRGQAPSKILPEDRAFTLLSWNICCTSAGYAISDGGVTPWSSRIDALVDQIVANDADINCLYEVFDVQAATYISERLKEHGYVHFYFNLGPNPVGVNSGIFVASKYDIDNPEFTAFPEDTLVGRTKYAAKGVFSFDVVSEGHSFARIFATHLQHSEEAEFPTPDEIEARRMQMQIIADKINTVRDRCIVLTGDLNLDDDEYDRSSWKDQFDKGDLLYGSDRTWGGDEFCALMVGKRPSHALNLDHTMIVQGTASSIRTSLVTTGFDPAVFTESALSDHNGLLSTITT